MQSFLETYLHIAFRLLKDLLLYFIVFSNEAVENHRGSIAIRYAKIFPKQQPSQECLGYSKSL